MKYIASCSCGKDSLAMVLTLIEKKAPLDCVVFFDAGKEFESIYRIWGKLKVILAENNIFSSLPRFKITRANRYELWLPSDVSIRDVDEIVRLALVGKIKIKYGLDFDNKSLHWLSILCYMLDGGDIREDKVAFEDTKN